MTEHTLTELVDLYLVRCEVEGRSPRTVRAYRWTLTRFLRALAEDAAPTTPAAITREHLYGYLACFTLLSTDTRHRYFREVRCFFNWLVEAGYLERSPFRGMRNVRLPERIVQPFSEGDLSRLLAACVPDTPAGTRDRAMVLTLLDTGVRCSELVQLKLEDLDLADGRLRVLHGKGNRQRVVPFAGRCRAALVRYLAVRGERPGPLFVAATGHGELRPGMALQPNG